MTTQLMKSFKKMACSCSFMVTTIATISLLITTASSLLITFPQHKYYRTTIQSGNRKLLSRQEKNNDIYQDFDSFSPDNSSPVSSDFVAGLQTRVDTLANAKSFDIGDEVVDLPVICFDALLPGQRLTGSTTDPTFCEILRSLRLGGSFVMTSLNTKQRKLRRYATIAQIELVDVEADTDFSPTAVTFMIVGKRRCEILGAASEMKARVGRWRRDYDADGEETRLGWGDERFVDIEEGRMKDDLDSLLCATCSETKTLSSNEWNSNKILVIDENGDDDGATPASVAKATNLIPLIEKWYSLASNPYTFENTDVVAATRIERGKPGLRVNPTALLRKVRRDLGPMPPPSKPTSMAVWAAALINPLPALGVSTEIRGAILHVEGADAKLDVLERGLVKSINNLNGSQPL